MASAAQAHPAANHYPAAPHSGISNAKLGIWLFLASEIMLFATLFTTYIVLRTAAPSWPHGSTILNVPMALTNTFVLISSSVTIVMAYARAIEGDKAAFFRWMGLTLFLGLLFLGIKSVEYGTKFSHGIYPSTGIFYAVYFTLTGLHCLHVIGGLVFNALLLGMAHYEWDHPLFLGRVECAGLYWHFVDIVWIFLFPAIYLL